MMAIRHPGNLIECQAWKENKAVYTTTAVAGSWAGAVMSWALAVMLWAGAVLIWAGAVMI